MAEGEQSTDVQKSQDDEEIILQELVRSIILYPTHKF